MEEEDESEPTEMEKQDLHAGIEANLAGEPRDSSRSEAWLLGWDEAQADLEDEED